MEIKLCPVCGSNSFKFSRDGFYKCVCGYKNWYNQELKRKFEEWRKRIPAIIRREEMAGLQEAF